MTTPQPLPPRIDNGNPIAVSVVIATYNMGQFIEQAIDSVLAQIDFEPEIIVVDDGSTDGTADLLRRYDHNERVKIILQENLGQPKAKNSGILAARGKFIAFCDADDYWQPNKLALQLPIMTDESVGVVYSSTLQLFPDGTMRTGPTVNMSRGRVLNELFQSNFIPFGTAVVRRECFETCGIFDESRQMGIDWELWLRIAQTWAFEYVDEPTYVYRIWPGQMSNNWRERYTSTLETMQRFLQDNPGLLSENVVAAAYADTHVNHARQHLEHTEYLAAIQLIAEAIKRKPFFVPAWKLLLKTAIRASRNRRRNGTNSS